MAAVAALLGMHVGMGRCLFLEIFPADSVCFLLLFLPFSGRGSGPGREPQDHRVVAGSPNSPGSFSGSPSSPGRKRRASLAKWSKGSPEKTLRSKSERADDPNLEC